MRNALPPPPYQPTLRAIRRTRTRCGVIWAALGLGMGVAGSLIAGWECGATVAGCWVLGYLPGWFVCIAYALRASGRDSDHSAVGIAPCLCSPMSATLGMFGMSFAPTGAQLWAIGGLSMVATVILARSMVRANYYEVLAFECHGIYPEDGGAPSPILRDIAALRAAQQVGPVEALVAVYPAPGQRYWSPNRHVGGALAQGGRWEKEPAAELSDDELGIQAKESTQPGTEDRRDSKLLWAPSGASQCAAMFVEVQPGPPPTRERYLSLLGAKWDTVINDQSPDLRSSFINRTRSLFTSLPDPDASSSVVGDGQKVLARDEWGSILLRSDEVLEVLLGQGLLAGIGQPVTADLHDRLSDHVEPDLEAILTVLENAESSMD